MATNKMQFKFFSHTPCLRLWINRRKANLSEIIQNQNCNLDVGIEVAILLLELGHGWGSIVLKII